MITYFNGRTTTQFYCCSKKISLEIGHLQFRNSFAFSRSTFMIWRVNFTRIYKKMFDKLRMTTNWKGKQSKEVPQIFEINFSSKFFQFCENIKKLEICKKIFTTNHMTTFPSTISNKARSTNTIHFTRIANFMTKWWTQITLLTT